MPYAEKPIHSFAVLKRKLAMMDPDEGLRILAESPEFPAGAFLFVTKAEGKITLNITERVQDKRTHKEIPGKREKWLNPGSLEEAYRYILRYAQRPLQAWAY